jgi:cellobiose epimerase
VDDEDMKRRLFSMMPLAAVGAPLLPTRGELDLYIQRLEKTLFENILGFWYPKTVDPAGGYLLNHDVEGKSKGPGVRAVVTQARMVWFYARMARLGHEPKKMLEAAEHGYRFLREKLWDGRNGGLYWEVDALGKPTKTNKHIYGQSFAIYALAEYGMVSRRKDVLEFALKFFELLEKKSHDPVHGGYVEYFLSDWSTPPVNEPAYLAGSSPGMKLMNTHLHLMEAMTTLYQATKNVTVRDRLVELVSVQSNAVIRKPQMMATDKYDRDWSVRLEGDFALVSYGHDLENIWLLLEAAQVAGLSSSPFRDLFQVNFANCRKYGFDEAQGGFYAAGPLEGVATNRTKTWWVQAEALVSALAMYQMTSSTEYFEVFRKTWGFCEKHLIDWTNGDWHAAIGIDGKATGDKAGPWKAAYHNGRAMVECVARLKAIREKTS